MIQDCYIALAAFQSYPLLLKNRKRRVFGFGALLILVFWLLTTVVPAAGFQMRTGGISRIVETQVPEFTLQDGRLSIDGSFHYAGGRIYVDVNTAPDNVIDTSSQSFRTLTALNDGVVLVNSEMAVFSAETGGTIAAQRTQEIRFSDLSDLTLTKDDIRALVPTMNGIAVLICVIGYFQHLILFFLGLCVVALFGQLFARLMGLSLSFGQVYQLSVYTRAGALLVKAVLMLLGLSFPEYPAMSLLWSMFVLSRAYRTMREEGMPGPQIRGAERSPQESDGGPRLPTPKSPDGDEEPWFRTSDAGNAPAAGGGSQEPEPEILPEPEEKTPPKPTQDFLVPEPVARENLTPSDGWSFGSGEPGQEPSPENGAEA